MIGTVTFVGGKSGTFSARWAAFLESGDQLSATGAGTDESIGLHRWKTVGLTHVSDGVTALGEGELALDGRTWTGKNFEWK